MEHWLSMLFVLMELLAILVFFDAAFERRIHGKRFWSIFGIFCLFLFVYVSVLHIRISFIKIIGCTAILFFMNLTLYHGKLLMRLMFALSGYAVIYLVGFMTDISVLALTHLTFEEYVNNQVFYVIIAIAQHIASLILAILFKHFHRPRKLDAIPWAFATLLVPLSSLLLLIPLYFIFLNSPQQITLLMMSVTVLVGANIGIIILNNWLEESALMRNQVFAMSERLTAQEQSVEALSASYIAQRKMSHDFQHHIAALSDLLQSQNIPAAEKYLKELQAQQTNRLLLVSTHHAAIDAVLNQKAQYAQKRDIDIQFEVNDLSGLRIQEIDCTVVLANLLDNAIEACLKLDTANRWIRVTATRQPSELSGEDTLLISVLNTSPPTKITNGTIATSKEDALLHGFGLSNIAQILAQYEAESAMDYQDGTFQFTIFWPNKAPQLCSCG